MKRNRKWKISDTFREANFQDIHTFTYQKTLLHTLFCFLQCVLDYVFLSPFKIKILTPLPSPFADFEKNSLWGHEITIRKIYFAIEWVSLN